MVCTTETYTSSLVIPVDDLVIVGSQPWPTGEYHIIFETGFTPGFVYDGGRMQFGLGRLYVQKLDTNLQLGNAIIFGTDSATHMHIEECKFTGGHRSIVSKVRGIVLVVHTELSHTTSSAIRIGLVEPTGPDKENGLFGLVYSHLHDIGVHGVEFIEMFSTNTWINGKIVISENVWARIGFDAIRVGLWLENDKPILKFEIIHNKATDIGRDFLILHNMEDMLVEEKLPNHLHVFRNSIRLCRYGIILDRRTGVAWPDDWFQVARNWVCQANRDGWEPGPDDEFLMPVPGTGGIGTLCNLPGCQSISVYKIVNPNYNCNLFQRPNLMEAVYSSALHVKSQHTGLVD